MLCSAMRLTNTLHDMLTHTAILTVDFFLESDCLGSGTTQTSESHSKNSKVVTADRILITLQRVLSVILIFSEYYSFFIDIDTVDTSHDFANWLCFMTKSFSIQN